ncbi:hypothetical protein Tco_1039530 [Tanacetum coccineum]
MIRVAASKVFSITFTVFIVSASLERPFVVLILSHESSSFFEELIEVSYRHGVLSSSLPEVKHSSSLDSFLAFKARDFLSTFANYFGIFLNDNFVNFEVPDKFIKR